MTEERATDARRRVTYSRTAQSPTKDVSKTPGVSSPIGEEGTTTASASRPLGRDMIATTAGITQAEVTPTTPTTGQESDAVGVAPDQDLPEAEVGEVEETLLCAYSTRVSPATPRNPARHMST